MKIHKCVVGCDIAQRIAGAGAPFWRSGRVVARTKYPLVSHLVSLVVVVVVACAFQTSVLPFLYPFFFDLLS